MSFYHRPELKLSSDLVGLECSAGDASSADKLLDQIIELAARCYDNAPFAKHFNFQIRLVNLFVRVASEIVSGRIDAGDLNSRIDTTLQTLSYAKLRPKSLLGLLQFRIGKNPTLSFRSRIGYLRQFAQLRYYPGTLICALRASMGQTVELDDLAEILRALIITKNIDFAANFRARTRVPVIIPDPDLLKPAAALTIHRVNRVLSLNLDRAFVSRLDQRVRSLQKMPREISGTEEAVGEKLRKLGYSVYPQMSVHGYAVDLLIADFDGSVLAIEVMGEKYHYLTTGSRKKQPNCRKVMGCDFFKWMVLRTSANVCYLPIAEIWKPSESSLVEKIRERINISPE
jgi:hypothetical protein